MMFCLQKSSGDKTIGVWRNSKHGNKTDVAPGKMTAFHHIATSMLSSKNSDHIK